MIYENNLDSIFSIERKHGFMSDTLVMSFAEDNCIKYLNLDLSEISKIEFFQAIYLYNFLYLLMQDDNKKYKPFGFFFEIFTYKNLSKYITRIEKKISGNITHSEIDFILKETEQYFSLNKKLENLEIYKNMKQKMFKYSVEFFYKEILDNLLNKKENLSVQINKTKI